MAKSVERRRGERRKAPIIRSGKERRDPAIPPPPNATRSGNERRKRDRRKGDRRKAN